MAARQCPLLLPQDREKRVYDGFITAQDRDFRLRILLPSDYQLQNARLQCSWQLKKVLHGYHQIVKQRLQHSSDLASFMLELKTILESALKNTHELHSPPPPQYYSCLVKEIECLGWDKLVFVDPEFSTIKLKAEDVAGREHTITLKFKAKYPVEPPDCIVDLPIPFVISWSPQRTVTLGHHGTGGCKRIRQDNSHETGNSAKKSSLASIQTQFLAALDSLKVFWDAMDEIDEKTWVLEPEKPTRSATLRRIAIGNNVSVSIDVDPRHPTMLPECYFLGADHVVNPLKMKLNNNIHMWDPENTLLLNLKDVLEIDFPSRSIIEKADYSMDCGICYAYRLDNAIPDQVCDDPRCGQPFHQACLYEWLRGLPSSRQSFNVIFGECPYCSKPIVLKMSVKKP